MWVKTLSESNVVQLNVFFFFKQKLISEMNEEDLWETGRNFSFLEGDKNSESTNKREQFLSSFLFLFSLFLFLLFSLSLSYSLSLWWKFTLLDNLVIIWSKENWHGIWRTDWKSRKKNNDIILSQSMKVYWNCSLWWKKILEFRKFLIKKKIYETFYWNNQHCEKIESEN